MNKVTLLERINLISFLFKITKNSWSAETKISKFFFPATHKFEKNYNFYYLQIFWEWQVTNHQMNIKEPSCTYLMLINKFKCEE